MDPELNQKLANLTMSLIDKNQGQAAEVTNNARNALTDLTKKFEYYKVKSPRPESIGQGHRICIMMQAEIDRLRQELETERNENESNKKRISDYEWSITEHQMGI